MYCKLGELPWSEAYKYLPLIFVVLKKALLSLLTGIQTTKATKELFENAARNNISKSISCSRVSSTASNDSRNSSPMRGLLFQFTPTPFIFPSCSSWEFLFSLLLNSREDKNKDLTLFPGILKNIAAVQSKQRSNSQQTFSDEDSDLIGSKRRSPFSPVVQGNAESGLDHIKKVLSKERPSEASPSYVSI